MPAVNACNAPVYPYDIPPFCPPYALGLIIALVAIARTRRGLAIALALLRVGIVAMFVGGVICIAWAPAVAAALCLFAAVFLAIVGLTRQDERAVAILAITANAIWAVWFVLWCTDNGAMVGVYAGLLSSLGMIVGGVIWLGDLALARMRPDLPTATVISSGK
jgi:hypothetical protein